MKRFFGKLLAWIGGIVVLFIALILAVALWFKPSAKPVASSTILELNLETALAEQVPEDPFAQLQTRGQASVRGIVEALEKAGGDSKIKGLIAYFGGAPISMAEAQEIRDAVTAFRAKKKFAVAYSETFGEVTGASVPYYIASAFDEIWMQPSGDVGLYGVKLEARFVKGTLDKLNVQPRMDHRYEYKNAMNTFTETKFTAAHRESYARIKDSWYGQMVKAISQDRKLGADEVRAAIDRAPLLGKEAVDAHLVDGLGYKDEFLEKTKAKVGKDAKLLWLSEYGQRGDLPHRKGKRVALIFGVGGVNRGKSEYDPLQGQTMGSETVAGAFRKAIEDKDVKAILFRVDSPGGSYVASDTIWREVVRARKAGKPVVVSMSTLAGSGGYFVAMAADKIVAQPGTITGSIGVLGGKMITKGLWEKIGISFDSVSSGAHAEMWNNYQDFSKDEWTRFEAWLDRVYADFTSKVADGRKLPKERVLEIAKGRIWTGEDAKNIGLVDELGGYPTALRLVKQLAKIAETEDVELKVYPPPKTRLEAIQALLEGGGSENSEAEALAQVLVAVQPIARALRSAGLLERGDTTLAMPDVPAR